MPSAIASVVGSVGSAILGSKAASGAAKHQVSGLNQAAQETLSARDYFNEIQQPYHQVGMDNLNPLVQAIQGTDNHYDPLLAQVQDQASRDVMQNAALSGRFGSGDLPGLMAGAMVNPAMQARQQRIQNLSGLVDMGRQAGNMMGQNNVSAGSQLSNIHMGVGNANAGAKMGKYAGYQNALSGISGQVGNFFS